MKNKKLGNFLKKTLSGLSNVVLQEVPIVSTINSFVQGVTESNETTTGRVNLYRSIPRLIISAVLVWFYVTYGSQAYKDIMSDSERISIELNEIGNE